MTRPFLRPGSGPRPNPCPFPDQIFPVKSVKVSRRLQQQTFATNRVAQGLDCVLVLEALESGRRPVIPKVTSTHCGAVRCQGELRSLLYNREQSSGREGGREETNCKAANKKIESSTLTEENWYDNITQGQFPVVPIMQRA